MTDESTYKPLDAAWKRYEYLYGKRPNVPRTISGRSEDGARVTLTGIPEWWWPADQVVLTSAPEEEERPLVVTFPHEASDFSGVPTEVEPSEDAETFYLTLSTSDVEDLDWDNDNDALVFYDRDGDLQSLESVIQHIIEDWDMEDLGSNFYVNEEKMTNVMVDLKTLVQNIRKGRE